MKEIVVLSGKGGTGKTSITASLAAIAKNSIIVDCDVDAADLHLILQPEIIERYEFYGSKEASILQDKCIKCGNCYKLCRFAAVQRGNDFSIDPILCEGCGVCAQFCPVNAIIMKDVISGEWYYSKTRMGYFAHARLGISGENSGKLVSLVRTKAKQESEKNNNDYILIDGPPGIGCPVIASMTGTDYVLIVTEPTMSGLHDYQRILELISHFKINSGIVINKCDINSEKVLQIRKFAEDNNVEVLAEIPCDKEMYYAQIAGKALTEYSEGNTSKIIRGIWDKIS